MLFGGDKCSLLPQLLPILMIMHLQEEPLGPLNEYAQCRVDNIAENQARLAASVLGATINVLEATQPAANEGKKRRADQENIPKLLCSCGCGANTCCAQSQHNWLPPTSRQHSRLCPAGSFSLWSYTSQAEGVSACR